MKNKKLKLNDLKVSSFVTNLNDTEKQTVDGGSYICSILVSIIVGSLYLGSCTCNADGLGCGTLKNIIPAIRSDQGCSGAQFSCPTDPQVKSVRDCYTEQVACGA